MYVLPFMEKIHPFLYSIHTFLHLALATGGDSTPGLPLELGKEPPWVPALHRVL